MPEVDAKSFKKTVRKKDINESLRIEQKKEEKGFLTVYLLHL